MTKASSCRVFAVESRPSFRVFIINYKLWSTTSLSQRHTPFKVELLLPPCIFTKPPDTATAHVCAVTINCACRSSRPRREATAYGRKPTSSSLSFATSNLRSMSLMFDVTLSALRLCLPRSYVYLLPKSYASWRRGRSDYPQPTSSIVSGGSAASVNPALLMKATSGVTVTW